MPVLELVPVLVLVLELVPELVPVPLRHPRSLPTPVPLTFSRMRACGPIAQAGATHSCRECALCRTQGSR